METSCRLVAFLLSKPLRRMRTDSRSLADPVNEGFRFQIIVIAWPQCGNTWFKLEVSGQTGPTLLQSKRFNRNYIAMPWSRYFFFHIDTWQLVFCFSIEQWSRTSLKKQNWHPLTKWHCRLIITDGVQQNETDGRIPSHHIKLHFQQIDSVCALKRNAQILIWQTV